MIQVEVQGLDRLKSRLRRLSSGLPLAVEGGTTKALRSTADAAIRLTAASIGRSIKVEIIDRKTEEVLGRVYTDTSIASYAPYVEFGTGLYVDDQGNDEAIRLKRATQIPWYIHESMVPPSFAKYGYPLVVGRNGERFWMVHGAHPHPYMHPAAFQRREDNRDDVAGAIDKLWQEVFG